MLGRSLAGMLLACHRRVVSCSRYNTGGIVQRCLGSTADIMSSYTDTAYREMETLAEESQALLSAAAGIEQARVCEARRQLSLALARNRRAWARIGQQATTGAPIADQAVRNHPYVAAGLAFGVSFLPGRLGRPRR